MTITYFFTNEPAGNVDADNMLKPILDGLTALIYRDDMQVFDLLARKRALDPSLLSDRASPLLVESFGSGHAFVHVRVEGGRSREVVG